MIKIPLGDYVALIDDEDLGLVANINWYPLIQEVAGREQVYALSYKDYRTVPMHRLIMGAGKREEVDHIDGDGLNNQRFNLRIVTHQQNSWNSLPKPKTGAIHSIYKGVIWHSSRVGATSGRWAAELRTNGKRFKKYFSSEREAALYYNEMATEHFGEFAKLNEVS